MSFHEILFPLDIALKSAGGPERRTDIVAFGSGREERNARWAHSRRRFDAGYGVKSLEALQDVVAFFEERRGQLYGFRWRDRLDHSSAVAGASVTPLDQLLTGDDTRTHYQLQKTYGSTYAPYTRNITKPVPGSVRVAVAGTEVVSGVAFTCDTATGIITFLPGHVPAVDAAVTAGFLFDVPVHFDTDYLEVDLSAFTAGAMGATSPTPEAVNAALPTSDADKLALAESAWSEAVRAEAEAARGSVEATQETIRAELASEDALQRWWRPIYAFELTLECAALWTILLRGFWIKDLTAINTMIGASGLLVAYWGFRFGVLGVYISGRSREKMSQLTGESQPGVVERLVKAVVKKK